jgi:hypothetical protein
MRSVRRANVAVRRRRPLSTFDRLFGLLGVVSALLMFRIFNVYRPLPFESAGRAVARMLAAWLWTQFLMGMLSFAWPGAINRYGWIVRWTVCAAILLVVARYTMYVAQRRLHARGYGRTRIALVTTARNSPALLAHIASNGNAAR